MFKWIVGLVLSSYQCTLAQPNTTFLKVVIQDDSLKRVLQQFVQVGQRQGLHKDGSLLLLHATNSTDPLQARWHIGAINATSIKPDKLKEFVPAHVSEFEGYSVLIYFTQQPTQFFTYPPTYLAYLSKMIDTKFQHKSSHQTLTTGDWEVTFSRGIPNYILIEK